MFNTHLKTLESFFKVVLQNVSNDILELINSLVIEAYEYKNINDKTNFNELKNTDFPIFSDLLFLLNKKINDDNIDSFLKEKYQNAQIHLLKFTSGRYSDIWNNPSTLEIDADIINFNFQSLFTSKNNTIANAQMLLIFRFIEQEIINKRKTNKNEKTMIVIDEAHMFIDHKYPIALDFFYQMNKRIRKYNGSFIPVTQNISDWNSSLDLRHKTSTIIKNSQYTFIFKSSSPDMQDLLDIYKAGNSFNKEERKIIISSSTGQVFFIASQDLRFPVQIKMNDEISKLF
jgi:DNA helicase HerA-like ATPase